MNWDEWVIELRRDCSQRLKSARRTFGDGSSLWPSPKPSADKYGNPRDQDRHDLQAAVRMFPTPTDPSKRGGPQSATKRRAGGHAVNLEDAVMSTSTANRRSGLQSHGTNILAGSLNPAFVEWLQGVPIGWTAFEPLETQSYQEWRRSHGEL